MNNGASATPSSGTLASGGSVNLALNYVAAATHLMTLVNGSGGTVSGGSNGNGTSSIVVSAAAATTATLSGGTGSGTTNVAMPVAVTLNGPVPAGGFTATLSRSGVAGSLASSSLVFTFGGATTISTTNTNSADGTSSVAMSGSGALTLAGTPQSYTSSVAAAGTPQPFTLTSASTGVQPFAIGHAFRQGDIPAASGIAIAGATAQAIINSTWPDGSAKFALIAGTYTSAGAAVTVTPSAGAAIAGAALTTAALPSGIRATGISIDGGAFGTATWAGVDFDSPFQTWVSGPQMSCWVYRKAIGADAHLVAWLEIRLFAGGAVEVLPWVENGYLNVAGPTNKSSTYSFALGGTSRFSAAIDLLNHQRTPLVSGALISHWLGADPGVTAKHSAAYMQATRMVPSYSAVVPPGAAIVTGLPATYAPLQQGSHSPSMGGAGYHPSIGMLPQWDVLHLTTTADVSAAIQRNAYSAGRYGIHFRDETTNRPLRFSSYPNLVMGAGSGVSGIGASSTNSYTPAATGTSPPAYASTHHPSMGCMAYLISGRFYHLETTQFVAAANFLKQGNTTRELSDGVFLSSSGSNTPRGVAWAIRSLAQTAAITPDADALKAEMMASVAANVAWNHARYVAQANNPQGWIQTYSDYTPPVNHTTQAGTTSTEITFAAGYVSVTDGAYVGWEIAIGAEVRTVTAYVGATRTATVSPAFTVNTVSQPYELRSDNVYFDACWMQDFVTAAFGYAISLNLGLSGANITKLAAFFAWKAQSVVGRLGGPGATEYLYRDAAQYTIATAPSNQANWVTGAGPWFANFGALYDSTMLIQGSPGPRTEGDLRGGNFPDASSYWGNMQPALAYAIEHGISGAAVGYNRMVGAANWGSFVTSSHTAPEWSVKPPVVPVLPAWRTALAPWQWTELATADIINVGPSFIPGQSLGASRRQRIDAWNGMTVIGSKVCMAAIGGHTDWGGNEGYSCDLSAAAPVWQMLGNPTPEAQMVIDATHYADGRPTASHTYYSLHADAGRNKIFRVGIGSAWGSGNFQRRNVDAFSLTTNDWDAALTWPSLPEDLVYGKSQCQHPVSGDIYACGNIYLWRFNLALGTWTQLAAIPSNGSAAYYRASVIDTVRNRLVVLGNAYATPAGIMIYNIATNAWSTATLTGANANVVAAEAGDTAHYNALLDKYLHFPGASTVIEVDPATLATTARATTGGGLMPDSSNGVFQKLVYVAALKGYAYQIHGTSKLWFLASE